MDDGDKNGQRKGSSSRVTSNRNRNRDGDPRTDIRFDTNLVQPQLPSTKINTSNGVIEPSDSSLKGNSEQNIQETTHDNTVFLFSIARIT